MNTQNFDFVARSKAPWKLVAENLFHSSEVLWKECLQAWEQMNKLSKTETKQPIPLHMYPGTNVWPTSQMLAGLALENLLKCIIIRRDPTLVKEGSINRTLITHNLLELFKRVEIQLTSGENDLISKLEIMVKWGGKYPLPQEATNNHVRATDGKYFETFEALYKKTLTTLEGSP